MAELKLPRLLGAAKEFNVGQDTLIDFLIGKGFPKDDLKPTSKLTEDMYRSLQLEFSSDKAAKMKSDQLELPKGAVAETKKKKEEEEILFKKEEKPSTKLFKKDKDNRGRGDRGNDPHFARVDQAADDLRSTARSISLGRR